MAVWAYDGWPVCGYQNPGDRSYVELRACPGFGDDRRYGPGQSFYDDILQDDISYEHALQRVDTYVGTFTQVWYPPGYSGQPQPPIPDREPPADDPPPPAEQPQLPAEVLSALATIYNAVGGVSDAVDGAYHSLVRKLDAAVGRVEQRVDTVVNEVGQRIANEINGLEATVGAVEQRISGVVAAGVAQLAGAVDSVANSIAGQVETLINTLLPTITENLTGGFRALGEATGDVAEAIGTLDQLPEVFLGELIEWGKALWPSWIEPLRVLVTESVSGLMHSLEGEQAPEVNRILDELARLPLPPVAQQALALVRGRDAPLFLVPLIAVIGGAVLHGAISAGLGPQLGLLRQQSLAATRPELPTTTEVAAGVIRGAATRDELIDVNARTGFPDRWAELTLRLQEQLLGPTQWLDLWLRGIATTEQIDVELAKVGLSAENANRLRQLTQQLPPVQDAIRMMVREVFTPSVRSAFGLDEGFPPDSNVRAAQLFQQIGLPLDTARDYWAAHWELPSITQGFEMLHRSLISPEQLNQLITAHDVMPVWRAPLIALSYSNLTRVDTRRMFQLGILTKDEVAAEYEKQGYTKQNAQRLADFTEADTKKTQRDESEVFRAPLRGRIITAVVNGTISDGDAQRAFAAVGYDDVETRTFLAEAAVIRESETDEAIRAGVKKLYVSGQWTWQQASERLQRAGFGAGEVQRAYDVWSLDLELRELTQAERDDKDLTKSEIVSAYRERMVDRAGAVRMLGDAGYSADEQAVILGLADVAIRKAERQQAQDAIRAQFMSGVLSYGDTSSALDVLGITVASRQSLLKKWQTEAMAAAPDLTQAQLKTMLKAGIVDVATVRTYLAERRWSNTDIDRVLQLWGYLAAKDAEKAAAKKPAAPKR